LLVLILILVLDRIAMQKRASPSITSIAARPKWSVFFLCFGIVFVMVQLVPWLYSSGSEVQAVPNSNLPHDRLIGRDASSTINGGGHGAVATTTSNQQHHYTTANHHAALSSSSSLLHDSSGAYRWLNQPINIKIYVYKLPARFNEEQVEQSKAANGGNCVCCSIFYGSEVWFHRNVLDSPYVTDDPEEADFFLVPAYVACFVKNGARIDVYPDLSRTSAFLNDALDWIRSEHRFWDRRGGEDHLWMFTQGFGAHLFGAYERIRRSIFLTTNGQYSEVVFQPWKDIVIPGRHRVRPVFQSDTDTQHQHQVVVDKPNFSFQGRDYFAWWGGNLHGDPAYSRGVRQYLIANLTNAKGFEIQQSPGRWLNIFPRMERSIFCLCTEGWWAWTPRPFEAMLSGCIPVLISDDLQYPFEQFLDWRRFSVKVSPQRIADLPDILHAISAAQIADMQAELRRVWRYFHFPDTYQHGFATDLILRELEARLNGIANRYEPHKRRAYEDEWRVPDNIARTPIRRGTHHDMVVTSHFLNDRVCTHSQQLC
jgi:hypothetical protein